MTKTSKTIVKAKPVAKPAIEVKAKKPAINKADYNTNIVNAAKQAAASAQIKKATAADKQALNAAYLSKLPDSRPVFQATFKPLNINGHAPQSATARDDAFYYALKTVYGKKPFTHAQSGADSGALARAIQLGNVSVLSPDANGDLQFSAVI